MYLKFNAVNSFMATVHDPLISDWSGNWTCRPIDKTPTAIQRYHHLLEDLNLVWLDASVFAKYSACMLVHLWIAVGVLSMGRHVQLPVPIRNQRIMYSGHKRIHCIKFQVHEIHHMIFMRDFVCFPAVCHSTKWSHSSIHVWSDCWPST